MSTTHPVDSVEAYIAEVRERLVGVPDDERAELLDEITTHVREVAEEHGADRIRERLGSPAQFGDELRASAGYASTDPAAPAPGALGRLRSAIGGRWRSARVQELRRELRPGWFVLRGVLFVYAVLQLAGVERDIVPRIGNSRLLGLAVLLLGAVASFVLGERRPATQSPWLVRSRVIGEAALVVLAFGFVLDAGRTNVVYFDSGATGFENGCLRDAAGRPIGNLYGYDPSGQLIPQFFLTDQAGRPIDNLCPDEAPLNKFGPGRTTYTRDVNGAPVYNVFPRKQEQLVPNEQTGEATWAPAAPPAVVLPQVAPPTTAPPPAEQPQQ